MRRVYSIKKFDRLPPSEEEDEDSSTNVQVVEILDHHIDEKYHLDTCPLESEYRQIAYDDNEDNGSGDDA